MRRGPSKALLLAMALAAENMVMTPVDTRRNIRGFWSLQMPTTRRYWLRKAKRVLARLHALGGGHG